MTVPKPTHDLFISHSSATKEIARRVYYDAVANGLFPWYDESLLRLGADLHREIERGVNTSAAFLLFHCEPAAASEWVQMEMRHARLRHERDPTFRIFVVRLDDSEINEAFWRRFLYLEWDRSDEPGSLLKLLCALTGKNTVVEITAASVLSKAPSEVFVNESATLAEHSRNFVFFYWAHVKQLLHALASVGFDAELRDSLRKIVNLSMIEVLPVMQGGLIPLSPGLFEVIHSNRMRIPPRISIDGLPDRFSWRAVENNEIFVRFEILEAESGLRVTYPTPLSLSLMFDAEL